VNEYNFVVGVDITKKLRRLGGCVIYRRRAIDNHPMIVMQLRHQGQLVNFSPVYSFINSPIPLVLTFEILGRIASY
jgi:hypothetical protein